MRINFSQSPQHSPKHSTEFIELQIAKQRAGCWKENSRLKVSKIIAASSFLRAKQAKSETSSNIFFPHCERVEFDNRIYVLEAQLAKGI